MRRLSQLAWRARKLLARLRTVVPQALHFAAILGGWALITRGLSAWTTRPDVVWPLSGGVFLLSVAGWGHLRLLADAGLYTLSRRAKMQKSA